MSKRSKKVKNNHFQLVNGKPMHLCTQWFLVWAVASTAGLKIVEESINASIQYVYNNPDLISSNLWLALFS